LTQVQSVKADNETNLAKFEYGYNTRDVRTFAEKTIGAATTQKVNYSYDQIDQLTKELSTEAAPALDKEYSYDAMGNRVSSSVATASTTYTSNNLNQITQTLVGANSTAIVYDANGNTLQIGAKSFGYNDADQLTSVVIPNAKKSEFVYDSDGRKRISKEFAWDAAANGGAGGWTQSDETRFVYDGMDLVQERSADGTVKASYVRDGNIGGILSRSTPDGTFYYHYDGNGNVVALTDANENIVAQYSYDAFGNTLSASGAQAEKNPFRFSSKYYDGDTGLYDYGLRHYDSSLGRWINRDPIGEDGGLNLYGMVANNPINFLDEYGERKIPTWPEIVAGAVVIKNGAAWVWRTGQGWFKKGGTTAGKTPKSSPAPKPPQPKTVKAPKPRHEGFIKQCRTMADKSLRSTIKSLEKGIREHQDKVRNNPNSRDVPHWRTEIKTSQEQLAIARREAQRRGW